MGGRQKGGRCAGAGMGIRCAGAPPPIGSGAGLIGCGEWMGRQGSGRGGGDSLCGRAAVTYRFGTGLIGRGEWMGRQGSGRCAEVGVGASLLLRGGRGGRSGDGRFGAGRAAATYRFGGGIDRARGMDDRQMGRSAAGCCCAGAPPSPIDSGRDRLDAGNGWVGSGLLLRRAPQKINREGVGDISSPFLCFWLCKGVFRGASPELVHTPLGCGFGFWVSKSDARYCCGHTFSPVFAGLPECRFSVPAPEFHRSVAVLAPIKKRSSHSHIPSSRSLSCNRLSGNKKAGTQMRTNYPQKG